MFDFFFKDATLYDSVVGIIGLTVVRRVADGVGTVGAGKAEVILSVIMRIWSFRIL